MGRLLALVFVASIAASACGSSSGDAGEPQAGRWAGEDPKVSFELTPDGRIIDFAMTVRYGGKTCTIRVDEIEVGSDRKISVDLTSVKSLSQGKMDGQFSGNSISGTYLITMCNRNISFVKGEREDRPWSAELKESSSGSLVPGSTSSAGASIAVPTASSAAVRPTGAASVYLSDLTPIVTQMGFGTYSVGRYAFASEEDNISVGDPIVAGDRTWEHGLAAHAPSRFDFVVGGQGYTRLTATVGMVDWIVCGDGVEFAVELDGVQVYRSAHIYADSPLVPVSVPIENAKVLTLRVEEVASMDCDWAVWGDPMLARGDS